MGDTTPQTADGKVLFHFAMSLDGFVAGPDHGMDWMTGVSLRPGLIGEYVETTGAILGGRNGWDQAIDGSRPYGGAWQGPIFVLTHHPEDAVPADDVTFLNCGPAEAVRIGLAAAGGKNLEVFSPTVGRQLLELGLIDEIDLHIVPVLLGEGIRLYDNPGGKPVRLHRVGDGDPLSAVNVRYRPASGLWTGPEPLMFTASTCAWMLLATRPTRRSCSSAAWAPRWTGGRTNSASGWRRAAGSSSATTIATPGARSATRPGRRGTPARTWRPMRPGCWTRSGGGALTWPVSRWAAPSRSRLPWLIRIVSTRWC